MCRRGLTILEMILALAVIAALFALVLPFAQRQLAERAFESTAEHVRAHLLVARAESMHTRTPLEVRYRMDESGGVVEIVPFAAAMRSVSGGEFRRSAVREGATDALAMSFDDTSNRAPEGIMETWKTLEIADGIQLTDKLAEDLDLDRLEGDSLDLGGDDLLLALEDSPFDPDPAGSFVNRPTIRLAAYLPDGSAIVSRPVWLLDEAGRRMKLSINAWTGAPTFERTVSASPVTPDDEAAADEESIFDDFGSETADEGETRGANRGGA